MSFDQSSDDFQALAQRITSLSPREPAERLRVIRAAVPGRIVLTTAFGLESQYLIHLIAREKLDIDLVTLDTGRLFPETYDVWAETEKRYGLRVYGIQPDAEAVEALIARDGPMGFRNSVEARQACCGVRKVAPLSKALAGATGWITGVRRSQSANRRSTQLAEVDQARGMLKFAPLFDWDEAEVASHVHALSIPYNSLMDRGFRSVGCQPCTRAVKVGEDPRAGRWWWEDGIRECGLHVRPLPAVSAA